MSNQAVIFANGNINNYDDMCKYIEQKYIICADGGVIHTKKMNLIPDIIIGDLDSAPKDIIDYYKQQKVIMNLFPSKKDLTDTELCIDYAIKQKFKSLTILGGLGGRIDHTIGNINLLDKCLEGNIDTKIIGDKEYIVLINDKIILKETIGSNVSLLPFSDYVFGVCSKGLEYALNDTTLIKSNVNGISNVITSSEATVELKMGKLLIVVSK